MALAVTVLAAPGCRQIFGLDDPMNGSATTTDAPRPDAPASCTDGMLSPGETDLDCGGDCAPCAIGDACAEHADCTTNVCGMKVCLLAKSCLEIRDAGQLMSGVYSLAISAAPFDAYCDQTSAGGGWTLVMKLSNQSTALRYAAPQWTTAATLNETDLEPNQAPQGNDAKLVAFNQVQGTELRLQWLDPVHDFLVAVPVPRSALAVFMGPELELAGDEGNACHGSLLDEVPSFLSSRMRHSTGPQFFGINGEDMEAGASDSYLRFGFASNDEPTNTWSPHQAAGTDSRSLEWGAQGDCNACGCYGNTYEPGTTSANLWIR